MRNRYLGRPGRCPQGRPNAVRRSRILFRFDVNTIRALRLLLSLSFPHARLLQLGYLPKQRIVVPLEPAYLADHLLEIGIVRLDMGRFNLLQVLGRVPQGQQWRRLQPALLGGGRQGTIGAGCVVALDPQLLSQEAQKEVSQGLGAQSSGIVRGCTLEELVGLEGFGDAHKVVVVEAVLGDCAEQQQCLERRV